MFSWLKKLLWCLVALFGLWCAGLAWFVTQIPGSTASAPPAADAIVVLTGGKGRLEYGLLLLVAGKGSQLFITGAGKKVSMQDIIHLSPPDLRETVSQFPAGVIELGRQAENTIGNAEETARWARAQGYTHLLLVTANYHMPRGLSEFREIMPDIAFTPAPVFPGDASATLVLSEYHKYLAGITRHWLVTLLRTS